ncbi:MAG TPA: hypothetical protein VL241_08820 [Gemmatimonadales bacterium]|jgi:hypothetical protein|nr:hypothetical protein [Gemmatimonadales bacterium]
MTDKLTPQQQTQLEALATLPPRLEVAHRLIEELAALRADDAMIRRLCRLLDEGKAAVNAIGQSALAETLGMMSMLARRGGDRQMKVRGLREGLASLKINYEGAVRAIRLPSAGSSSKAAGPPKDPKSTPPSR